jgi:hypothetical protein
MDAQRWGLAAQGTAAGSSVLIFFPSNASLTLDRWRIALIQQIVSAHLFNEWQPTSTGERNREDTTIIWNVTVRWHLIKLGDFSTITQRPPSGVGETLPGSEN